MDSDGDSINDLMQLDSDGDGCFDVVEAGYLEQDDDGIYGLDPNPNIVDGTVDDKGRIVDPDYDYTIEPKINSSGKYFFQSNSPAPTIDIPPVSTLACYEGAPAEFEVIPLTPCIICPPARLAKPAPTKEFLTSLSAGSWF